MASLDKIEREHKKIFNELSLKEKLAFYKNLSEAKFNNFFFISEDGTITEDSNKFKTIDNITLELNENPNDTVMLSNCSLAIISDYEALEKKYKKEVRIAFKFYYYGLVYNLTVVENLIYFLESFLGVYTEEPSEALYYVLQEVAKTTNKDYNEAITVVNDVLNNISELAEGLEELPTFKKEVEETASKYNAVYSKIMNLSIPEGVVKE